MTIANIHKPIMVEEILSFIKGDSSLNVLDCTFGGGGHTRAMLESSPEVCVVAIDQDPEAEERALALKKLQTKLMLLLRSLVI